MENEHIFSWVFVPELGSRLLCEVDLCVMNIGADILDGGEDILA